MGFVNIKCIRQKQKEKSSDFVMKKTVCITSIDNSIWLCYQMSQQTKSRT